MANGDISLKPAIFKELVQQVHLIKPILLFSGDGLRGKPLINLNDSYSRFQNFLDEVITVFEIFRAVGHWGNIAVHL